jgi:hypothetical protein
MTGQDNGMLVVGQHIVDLFVKCAGRDGHSFAGKIVQALSSCPDPGNASAARHIEGKIARARSHVAINIAAAERGVCFSNDLLKRVRHVWNSTMTAFPIRPRIARAPIMTRRDGRGGEVPLENESQDSPTAMLNRHRDPSPFRGQRGQPGRFTSVRREGLNL